MPTLTHHCQFGSRHRKATLIHFGCTDNLDFGILGDPARCCCRGRRGVCSLTGLKHIQLQGALPAKAAEYPLQLASALARCLCSAELANMTFNDVP